MVSFSGKIFVDQLHLNSKTIQEINNAFHGHSELLDLISYYESDEMHAVGVYSTYSLLISQVIVPRDSATLGLSGEKASALHKWESPGNCKIFF